MRELRLNFQFRIFVLPLRKCEHTHELAGPHLCQPAQPKSVEGPRSVTPDDMKSETNCAPFAGPVIRGSFQASIPIPTTAQPSKSLAATSSRRWPKLTCHSPSDGRNRTGRSTAGLVAGIDALPDRRVELCILDVEHFDPVFVRMSNVVECSPCIAST